MFDEQTGFWIVHSVPRFPEQLHSGQYVFPENARENGQSILCVTFPTSQLETIGKYLSLFTTRLIGRLYRGSYNHANKICVTNEAITKNIL